MHFLSCNKIICYNDGKTGNTTNRKTNSSSICLVERADTLFFVLNHGGCQPECCGGTLGVVRREGKAVTLGSGEGGGMKENVRHLFIQATRTAITSSGRKRTSTTSQATRLAQYKRDVHGRRVFGTCFLRYCHKQRGNECDESGDGTCTIQEGCARCEGVEHLLLVLLPRAVGERQRRAIRRDLRRAKGTCKERECSAPASCATTESSRNTERRAKRRDLRKGKGACKMRGCWAPAS